MLSSAAMVKPEKNRVFSMGRVPKYEGLKNTQKRFAPAKRGFVAWCMSGVRAI